MSDRVDTNCQARLARRATDGFATEVTTANSTPHRRCRLRCRAREDASSDDASRAAIVRTIEGAKDTSCPTFPNDRLSPIARDAAREAGLEPSERNPFKSIVVRSVELVYAADEALRIIAEYEEPDAPAVEVEPRAGVGYGCTEAPRGILYHRYEIDAEGSILDAKIVPPTSQNQRTIEEDLRGVVERSLDMPDEELTIRCEQTIRNYDPCISCATHFLTLEVERR